MGRRLEIVRQPSHESAPTEPDLVGTVWTNGTEFGYMAYIPRYYMDGVHFNIAVIINLRTGGHVTSCTSAGGNEAQALMGCKSWAEALGWRPTIGRLHIMEGA